MKILVRDIRLAEKLASAELDDLVQNAIEIAKNMGAKKIAVYDKQKNYWVVSLWRLNQLDPKVSLKQTYGEKKEIFEKVDTVSSKEEITKVIAKLYEFPGLIVIDGEKMTGFISLADFSDSQLMEINSLRREDATGKSLTIVQIKQKAEEEGLIGADLSNANLSNADLKDFDMRGINLSGADLSKADLWRANLTGANLSNANLSEAKLRYAILNGAKLIKAKLNNADLRNAQLLHADMEETQLEGANLTDAVLFNANLKSANLKKANLNHAGLNSAKLYGADLTNAIIRDANLKDADFDETTILKDVDITDEEIKKILKEKHD